MHEKEIKNFIEALQLAKNRFYVDAIQKFQNVVDEFPESDLADDALYNLALCYYEMNQFYKSIEVIENMIQKYPDATITALENSNEFGKTAAKGYYLIFQCHIGLGNIEKAKSYLPILDKYPNTYVIKDSLKYSFRLIADNALETFEQINNKEK